MLSATRKRKGNRAMEPLKLQAKHDRRTLRRILPKDIADRAYELYERRGSEHGHDSDDWSEAERELKHNAVKVARS
jgi:hypothetical protein